MVRNRWSELSPTARRLIIAGATVEGALKTIALIDLARRPPSRVQGSKKVWALAITFVNSAGAVPMAYFLRGRRR
jgi:hypothetical protein